jgi:pimeloyl-ACP methyl ester carboxylesterase
MTTPNTVDELKPVDTPAGRVAYRETGDPNAPVALDVHGVIGNGHLWRHQLEAVTDIRRNLAEERPDELNRQILRLWELDR